MVASSQGKAGGQFALDWRACCDEGQACHHHIVNIIFIIVISMVRFDYELFVYKGRSPLMTLRQSGKQILCQKIVKCGGVH